MTWVRLDDQFFAHRKVVDLSKDAKLLHLAAITHCAAQLTDGEITPGALRVISALVDVTGDVVAELVTAGLWEARPVACYAIHDYLAYQPSAAQVKAERQASVQRQAAFRERKLLARMSNGVSNAPSNGVSHGVSHTYPIPIPIPTPIPDPDPVPDPSAIDHPDAAADRARAREAGGGGEDASRRGEPDDAAPEMATPAMPRALVAKVAKAARLHSCDLTALADVLGPYHARDPAWLIGQAAAFADWYADPRAGDPKRKPKHPTIRHLGSWLAQPVARAAPTPEKTGAMNGATTNGPSEPTPAAAAARRDQDEYDRYWAELRRLGVGGVNGYRAPKRPAAADVAERPGASGLAQLGTGPPASG